MKKKYLAPEVEDLEMDLCDMIAASVEIDDITTDPIEIIKDPTDDDLNWSRMMQF